MAALALAPPAEEIREKRGEIESAFADLMKTKMLAGKPVAAQWRFFRSCFNALTMSGQSADEDLSELTPVRAAQLKFEVEDRLRRFYLHPGKPLRYIFAMVHSGHLSNYVLADSEPYPSFASYCVLVREYAEADASGDGAPGGTAELKPYLERVVTECIDAEFRAYAAKIKKGKEGKMMARKISFINALLIGLSLIVCACTTAQVVLPPVTIDPNLPPEIQAFSAHWAGCWRHNTESMEATLSVEKIGLKKADVLYKWKGNFSWNVPTGQADIKASVSKKDGRTVLSWKSRSNGMPFVFWINEDGELEGIMGENSPMEARIFMKRIK